MKDIVTCHVCNGTANQDNQCVACGTAGMLEVDSPEHTVIVQKVLTPPMFSMNAPTSPQHDPMLPFVRIVTEAVDEVKTPQPEQLVLPETPTVLTPTTVEAPEVPPTDKTLTTQPVVDAELPPLTREETQAALQQFGWLERGDGTRDVSGDTAPVTDATTETVDSKDGV